MSAILLTAFDSAPKQALPIFSGEATTIAAGSAHAAAIMEDGNIWVSSSSISTRVTTMIWENADDWQDLVAVSAGILHLVGLRSDGTVVAAGENNHRQLDVSDWYDIVAVSAGSTHTVGLRSDGTVVTVGYGGYEQGDVTESLDTSDWSDIVAISAGGYGTIGLKSDGTVVSVGDNRFGSLDVADWHDIVAISAGSIHTIGLRSDGTVVGVGSERFGRIDVADWRDIVAIATGRSYTIGLKTDGTVVSTGRNNTQELPDDVAGWRDIVAIAGGQNHAIGLRPDGTVVVTRGEFNRAYSNTAKWHDIRMPLHLQDLSTPEKPSVVMELAVENDSNTLFARINELRAEASAPLLIRDEGLDLIAGEYATQLFFDSDAREGDFQSLPNGDRVISLAQTLDVAVTGFSYSVFLGFNLEMMEDTSEFISKAVDGDFARVGVICVREYDGFSNMIIIIYDNAPTSH